LDVFFPASVADISASSTSRSALSKHINRV
jgi:hypothetical protein